ILFLYTLGPVPETTLPDGCRAVFPKILVHIKSVVFNSLDHKSHFMVILRNWSVSVDLRRQIRRRNLRLANSHVTHLRPFEVNATANPVRSFVTHYGDGPIDFYETIFGCDPTV